VKGSTQFGFKNGFGTREALFSLTVLLKKYRVQQKDVFLCFVDYQKAFDSVKHTEMVGLLRGRMIDHNELRFIENLCKSNGSSESGK